MNRSSGLARLQIVYFGLAAILIAFFTVAAGGDEKASGWDRITNPHIVYWTNDRGLPDILTNQFWLPASLSTEEARARLVAEGEVSPTESVIPLFIYTWNDFEAWPVMWTGIGITIGIWVAVALVMWVAKGFTAKPSSPASDPASAQSQKSQPPSG